MTDEQRKRVHDITYSTQDREELAERIVRLEDERNLYSSLVEDMDHPDTANQLRAENDRLRKLCADMLACINAYKARKSICWECEHHRDVDELRSACFLGSDARKLGIEVGE